MPFTATLTAGKCNQSARDDRAKAVSAVDVEEEEEEEYASAEEGRGATALGEAKFKMGRNLRSLEDIRDMIAFTSECMARCVRT